MAIDPTTITPTLEQVAGRIRRRTKTRLGGEMGTFTAETRPTAEQAQEKIAEAARFVSLRLGTPGVTWDGDFLASARDAVAARAALKLETGFYSDVTSDSMVIELRETAREELAAAVTAAKANHIGGPKINSVRIGRPR